MREGTVKEKKREVECSETGVFNIGKELRDEQRDVDQMGN